MRLELTLTANSRADLLAQLREAIDAKTVHRGVYTVRIDFGGSGELAPGVAPDGGWYHVPGADCNDEDAAEFPGQVWFADCDGDTHARDASVSACDEAGANALTPCGGPPAGGWAHA